MFSPSLSRVSLWQPPPSLVHICVISRDWNLWMRWLRYPLYNSTALTGFMYKLVPQATPLSLALIQDTRVYTGHKCIACYENILMDDTRPCTESPPSLINLPGYIQTGSPQGLGYTAPIGPVISVVFSCTHIQNSSWLNANAFKITLQSTCTLLLQIGTDTFYLINSIMP